MLNGVSIIFVGIQNRVLHIILWVRVCYMLLSIDIHRDSAGNKNPMGQTVDLGMVVKATNFLSGNGNVSYVTSKRCLGALVTLTLY